MYETLFEAKLILVVCTALILLLISVIIAALLIEQKRKFTHRQELTDLQNQYDKTLLQAELKIQEETFKAISRNLHDNIGSNISTAMLLLYKDEAMAAGEMESNRQDALHLLDRVVDDLKEIARSLNPDYLSEIGLGEAIRQTASKLENSRRFRVVLQIGEPPHPLDQKKMLILFYIFQEAVNNIITHAGAQTIEIRLDYQPAVLLLNISDDGRGIPPMQAPGRKKGSGLININKHARLIGARLDIQSRPGLGTTILVTVPDPYGGEKSPPTDTKSWSEL